MEEGQEKEAPLHTVDRCLRLLQLFSGDKPEWTVGDASRALGISKSMTSRLVFALVNRGFAIQDVSSRRFRLGVQLITLGQVARESLDLNRAAHPVMRRLAAETGETALLAIADGDAAVTIEKVESDTYPIRLSMNLGTRSPLHAGASNKALLAFLPPERIDAYLSGPLVGFSAITITDPDALRVNLAEIRSRGYAFSKGELTPGIGAIGVPIFGSGENLVAALSIGGPLTRFGDEALPGLIRLVQQAARTIQRNLGFVPD